jgi:hypothetical protein
MAVDYLVAPDKRLKEFGRVQRAIAFEKVKERGE